MRYVIEIWSDIDQRYNPLSDIYTSKARATAKMDRYLADAAENGWETGGRVIEAEIRDKALREALV